MARGNFAGVRYELDELFKLSTMGRKPKAKKGSFASENAGFGLRKDTAELPGAGPEPAYSQTSTGTMNLFFRKAALTMEQPKTARDPPLGAPVRTT